MAIGTLLIILALTGLTIEAANCNYHLDNADETIEMYEE